MYAHTLKLIDNLKATKDADQRGRVTLKAPQAVAMQPMFGHGSHSF